MNPVIYFQKIPLSVIKGCTNLGGHKFDENRRCIFCGTYQWLYQDRVWERPLNRQEYLLSNLQLTEYRMLQLGLGTLPP